MSSNEKKWVRIVNGPVQVGKEVFGIKDYVHADAEEADALASVGYVKIVSDKEGEAAAAKVKGKAVEEPTEEADATKGKAVEEPTVRPAGKK